MEQWDKRRDNMKKEFENYVMTGDRASRKYFEGWELVAWLAEDEVSTPEDFDCYEPEDIELWKQGEWKYMGMVIAVYKNGVLLDEHAASLWGIDCNFPVPGNPSGTSEYLSEVFDDLEQEALEYGHKVLERCLENNDD
jgi:hypothetical protein